MTPAQIRRPIATPTLCLAFTLFTAAAGADETPVYDALRAARPEGRQLAVKDLTLERDVYRFRFDSGTFYFLPPVLERTFGAVFVGRGSYILSPASEQERRHLAFVTGEDDFEVLKDDFEALVLLFADDTFEELQLHGALTEGTVAPAATAAFEEVLRQQKKDFRTNYHVRLLTDLANAPTSRAGCFLAFVDGTKHPPALAAVDPRGAQAVASLPLLGGEDTLFLVNHDFQGGLWYMSHPQAEITTGHQTPYVPLADARHYEVEVEVAKDADVAGTTVIHFANGTPGLRALPLGLLPSLRVEKASYRMEDAADGGWTEIAFVQEDEEEDSSPVAVVFPESLADKAEVALKIEYAGEDVLVDAGEKNYSVRARTSWYPNFGVFDDMATFDLTYRVPAGNEVISVGQMVSAVDEGGHHVSVWKTEVPIRVAGFNYGRFKRLEEHDGTSGVDVLVYTNPGTPDIIREINLAMREEREGSFGGIGAAQRERSMTTETVGPAVSVNTGDLAQTALADGINAARVCTTYFGPLPQGHVAITQQSEWTFGQSWPSLIFMPYISFMTGTQRRQLGFGGGASDFVNEVGYHEFAHQWWGHLVGWESYRDQWLSEGFAEFSSALVLQHAQGWQKYYEHWDDAREFILERTRGSSLPNYQAGPITQGYRLATRRSPAAYQAMIYNKGGYVLHMLRMMMRQPAAPEPDAAFIAMMHDFVTTWGHENPSTDDFQAAVERHMVPAMNATGDGKMGWFFDQWVHGTDIPRYVDELEVEKAGGGKYRIHGTIRQEDVSPQFRALLPLYVEFKKGEFGQFGAVPMIGSSSREIDVQVELPMKPRRALVNAHHEVLAK